MVILSVPRWPGRFLCLKTRLGEEVEPWSRVAVNRTGAVGHAQAALVPALDNAGKALALALARTTSILSALGEDIGFNGLANFIGSGVAQAELTQIAGGGLRRPWRNAPWRAC